MPWRQCRRDDGIIEAPNWGRRELIRRIANPSILPFVSREHIRTVDNGLFVRNVRYSRKHLRILRNHQSYEIPVSNENNSWLGPFALQEGDVLQFGAPDPPRIVAAFRYNSMPKETTLVEPQSSSNHREAEIVVLPNPTILRKEETNSKAATAITPPGKAPVLDDANAGSHPDPQSTKISSVIRPKQDPTSLERPRKRVRFANDTSHDYIVFFVPKGSDMDVAYIEGGTNTKGLRQHVEERGIVTQREFRPSSPPTHLVISDRLSDENVVWEYLGFASRETFLQFVMRYNITCVYRTWATRTTIRPPGMLDKVLGLAPVVRATKNNGTSSTMRKTNQVNEGLSILFRTLAKWYQECPLLEQDSFRSYTFTVIAGRVRRLGYQITKDRLPRLEATKGFGASTLHIIREFIEHGTCQRLDQLKRDRKRLAMRSMMRIWGVGQAKATELVNIGHTHIGSVRKALKDGMLILDRNQYIGVLNYEDFLEEMSRKEVESIAEIIFAAVRYRYPGAEMHIMGSYRRGKETCGDVDILISHPKYADRIPPEALGRILDDLRTAGHISYHLTRVHGMKEALFETLPEHIANRMTVPKRCFNVSSDKYHVSSWMGVFLFQSKHRRVDIKWYPHNERIFATLYFTGNGHFNRSMRLWAKRRYSYRLSDHGLFDTIQNRPVLQRPQTEKEIFDILGLCWKEPNERDCFDAVETTNENELVFGMQMTKSEFMADTSAWVN